MNTNATLYSTRPNLTRAAMVGLLLAGLVVLTVAALAL